MAQESSGGRLRLTGMRFFAVIWSGQFFSLLETYMRAQANSIIVCKMVIIHFRIIC
jgi:hypothetical protein